MVQYDELYDGKLTYMIPDTAEKLKEEPMRRVPTPFGRAVRIRLAQLNLQQRDLARMLGTSDAFITYLIYGDRRDEAWISRICDALGMRAQDMPGDKDDRRV